MATVYKVGFLDDEYDDNCIHIFVKPAWPTLDSFKEALFDRVPMLKNQPFYMYYNGMYSNFQFSQCSVKFL